MPFFFDLSSLLPTVERNPFAPVVVEDEAPAEIGPEEIPAEPLVDTGLPIPSHYNVDLMRAMVQDPFHLFVHWQLKDNPFDRLRRIFPSRESANGAGDFHTVLKLIDETNRITVFFEAPFAREFWFTVYPDRTYRVELGMRSSRFGYIKLLSSQTVRMPRGAPSDQMAPDPEYRMTADDYLRVLRESHLLPERAFQPETWLPLGATDQTPERQREIWEALPERFRRLVQVMADIQAGRDYERLWERLGEEELTSLVREFLETMSRMGGGELGYMMLLRYLPELLRRVLATEGEIEISEPVSLYIARKIGLGASDLNQPGAADLPSGPWNPSASR